MPASTGGPAILRLHPLLTQRFLLGMLCDDIGVQPFCHLRAGGGASQLVEFVSGERLGLDDERGEVLRFDVAGVPEIQGEFVIRLDLLGHHADVAKFHAELVVGRAGLRVVGTPSVVAEGLKPCEDFIDGHADDYTCNFKQANLTIVTTTRLCLLPGNGRA